VVLTLGRLELNVKTWPVIIYIFSFSLLISLGNWQLNRSEVKRIRTDQIESLNQYGRTNLTELVTGVDTWSQYQDYKVTLNGQVLTNQVWYIENQVLDKQLGADCLVIVKLHKAVQESVYILVNLGWVPVDQQRLPVLPRPISRQAENLNVRLSIPGFNRFKDSDILERSGFSFVQQVDISKFEQEANLSLLPILAVVDKKSQFTFKPHWQPVVMPAEKHIGYAVQWFGLAVALSIIMIIKAVRWNKLV